MKVKGASDVVMKEWCRKMRERGDEMKMEDLAKWWLGDYEEVIERSVGWPRATKGKKRETWYSKDVTKWNKEMRKVMEEWLTETDEEKKTELGKERRRIRAERQREVRRERSRGRMKKMKELEERCRKSGGGENMLKQLQSWSGKKKCAVGGDRKRMKDKNGRWWEGQPMRDKWKELFEKVGLELDKAEGFDEEWKREVEEQKEEEKETYEEIEMEWKRKKMKTNL